MVSLKEIKIEEKDFLKSLLKDYLIELRINTNSEIDSEYQYLDSYFIEEERKAMFILNDNEIIGFVFVNDYCLIKTNEIAIAEFYIQKQFRNLGFAENAAKQVFKMHNKKWEIKTSLENKVALCFWRKVIGNFEEKEVDGELVFSF